MWIQITQLKFVSGSRVAVFVLSSFFDCLGWSRLWMQTSSDSLLTTVYSTVSLDQNDEMRCWSASLQPSLPLTVSVNLGCKTQSCSTALCVQFIWLSLSTGMVKREASILLFCSRKDNFFLCVKLYCRMLALLLPLHLSNVPLLPCIMHRFDVLFVWPMLQVYRRRHPSEQAPLEEDVHPPWQNKQKILFKRTPESWITGRMFWNDFQLFTCTSTLEPGFEVWTYSLIHGICDSSQHVELGYICGLFGQFRRNNRRTCIWNKWHRSCIGI